MIAKLCMACDYVYDTYDDEKAEVLFSHGYCSDCAQAVMADVDRQIAEMEAAEAANAVLS